MCVVCATRVARRALRAGCGGVCGPRSVPDTVRVRFSEAGEAPRPAGCRPNDTAVETNALSRPGRALARRADGDVPLYGARTRDCLPSQLGRTTGAAPLGAPRSSRQSRAAGAGARARCWPPPPPPSGDDGGAGSGARARPACAGGASVWPSIRYTTLRQAWPGTRGSPRPQCAFDWSMFV